MSLPQTEIYKISVGEVYFTVKKSVSMAYSPTDKVYDFVKVGGEDMCVEYKIDREDPTQVELEWLHTAGQKCVEGDMTIEGEHTLFLFYVSIQILKLYTPVTHLTFIDNSQFPCRLPNGKVEKIQLRHFYLLFHGKTWYHAKLGAYPSTPIIKQIYDSFAKNLDDPAAKPVSFDFRNGDLQQLFAPMLQSSSTWKAFFTKIKTIPELCQKIYPWYLRAANIIMREAPMPDSWIIDVRKLRFDPIPFERVAKTIGGRTRMKKYLPTVSVDYPVPSKCAELRYKS
jgi:hypothetical protein